MIESSAQQEQSLEVLHIGDSVSAGAGNSSLAEINVPEEHVEDIAPNHSMITRSKSGIVKPNPRYALNVTMSSVIPPEPKNVKHALAHNGWKLLCLMNLMP